MTHVSTSQGTSYRGRFAGIPVYVDSASDAPLVPESVKHWSLRSEQTKLIKMGGRLVRYARRLVFQFRLRRESSMKSGLAEVLVTREMLTGILERIGRLRLAPG